MDDQEDGAEWLRRELGDVADPGRRPGPSGKPHATEKAEAGIETVGPMRESVLVVDDEPMMLDIYRSLLTDDYDLHFASTGEEALESLRKNRPDVLILDYVLPGITGIDVCKRVRENHFFDAMKIIMVSGMASLSERIDGFRAGADDFLVKPIIASEFMEKIRANLRWSREQPKSLGPVPERIDRSRITCWEYKHCSKMDCPARVQGIGRLCWLVAGTMSGQKAMCTHSQKLKHCSECDFYIMMKS